MSVHARPARGVPNAPSRKIQPFRRFPLYRWTLSPLTREQIVQYFPDLYRVAESVN